MVLKSFIISIVVFFVSLLCSPFIPFMFYLATGSFYVICIYGAIAVFIGIPYVVWVLCKVIMDNPL